MRRGRLALGVALLGCASGAARPAWAEPAPVAATPEARATDDATPAAGDGVEARVAERAKQLYALGAEAFAAQRNADAISYFRRAAELVPSAKLTYNIGLAYEEMGDAGRALREYRDYLRQEPDGERRGEVEARVGALERRLAETGVSLLSVRSEPPGATVHIAGRARGITPWAGELPPGRHDVELRLAGHRPRRAEITLAGERSGELSLELPPEPRLAKSAEAPSGWARVSPLAWTFLGVGAAAITFGVAFELSRGSSSADARGADTPLAAAEARGAADAKQMASLLLLGFGGGLLIGGGVLIALDLSAAPAAGEPGPASGAATLGVQPAFRGVLARGQF